MDTPQLLDTDAAAAYLGLAAGTLRNWRHKGVGPRSISAGRAVRYRVADLDAWLDANTLDTAPVGA